MTMKRDPVLFVHIPKTAGTSLRSLLQTRFDRSVILDINDNWQDWEQRLARVNASELVTGHVGYGISNAFERRPRIVTFLRDPIDRAVSTYYFLRQRSDDSYARYTESSERARASSLARGCSLLEFITSESKTAAAHLGNVQTWYLSSQGIRRGRYRDVCVEDVEIAQRNLERCTSFGLVERSDESVNMISRSLGWAPFASLPHANQTQNRLAVSNLDQATKDALHEFTKLDRQLYCFARQLFEERWKSFSAESHSPNLRASYAVSGSMPAPTGDEETVFNFDRAIPGMGWYGADRIADCWFSWTGPDCTASIHLESFPRRRVILQVHVVHALKPDILHGTQLLVNDVPLETLVRPTSSGHILEGTFPAMQRGADDGTDRILIRVPEVLRPCDLDPTNADSRKLGLAISRIALVPAA